VLAFRVGRPHWHDFDALHALQEILRAKMDVRLVRRLQAPADHTADIRTERQDVQAYKRQVLCTGVAKGLATRTLLDGEDYLLVTRTRQKSQTYVRWRGYPKTLDSWIDKNVQMDGDATQA